MVVQNLQAVLEEMLVDLAVALGIVGILPKAVQVLRVKVMRVVVVARLDTHILAVAVAVLVL
jgi:hypothetical protein